MHNQKKYTEIAIGKLVIRNGAPLLTASSQYVNKELSQQR